METEENVQSEEDQKELNHSEKDHGDIDYGEMDHGDIDHGDVDHEAADRDALAALPTPLPVDSRPITNTKPDPTKATTVLSVNGLSVLCTNIKDDQVEVGFLDGSHFPVKIRIFKPNETKHWRAFDCDQNKKYVIRVFRTKSVGRGTFYHSTSNPWDRWDFRRMPDLKKLHPLGISIRSRAADALSAKLIIKDGVFYSAGLSSIPATIEDTKGSGIFSSDVIGNLLGATITCDPNDTNDSKVYVQVFEVGKAAPVFSEGMSRDSGPFRLSIASTPADQHDHMHMVYDSVISVKDPARFRIKYVQTIVRSTLMGYVANTSTKEFFALEAAEADAIPDKDRAFSESADDFLKMGYTSRSSDQYACQPLPDDDGPIYFP